MLIHIDHLRQQNRKVKLYAVFAVLGMAFVGGAIWAVIAFSEADLEAEEQWQPGASLAGDSGSEIDDAELERLAPLAEFTMVEVESEEEGEPNPVASTKKDNSTPAKERKRKERTHSSTKPRDKDKDQSDSNVASAFDGVIVKEPTRKSGALLASDKAPTVKSKSGPVKASSLATAGSKRRRSVDLSGTASLGGSFDTKGSKYAKTTSRKVKSSERNRFKSGLKKVSKAVQECHKRQLKTGRVAASKIYLVVTVEPDGSTSKIKIDKAIRGTAFEKCLISKKDRWVFETFEGKAVELRQGFVLE